MVQRFTIDLGKGVELSAPIKMDMTVDEWVRMTNYINGLLQNSEVNVAEDIVIIKE